MATGTKLSQIAASGGNPALTDTVVGVAGGTTDQQYTLTQIQATVLPSIITPGGPTGSASVAPIITYDAKGRLTAVSSASIAISAGAVSGLAPVATSGSASDLSTGTLPDARLSNTVTAGGPTGSATVVPVITYDAHGRLTAVTTASITQPSAANPTASVGLTAVNGSAATFMRSDAAPALASTISAAGPIGSATVVPVITYNAAGQLTTVTTANITYPGSFSGFANPTASVGLTAVNGVATTAMRSDAAPPLDQTAAYAFSGLGATRATTLTLGGATLGANALAITGTSLLQGAVNVNGPIQTLFGDIISSSGAGGGFTINGDVNLRRGGAAATLQLGAANAASPVAQTLQVQNAITANNNGAATFTHIASLAVGNGTSGDHVFQTGKNGNGSGVLATATTAMTIKGETQAIVIASGKTFQVGNAATTSLTPGVLAASTNASIVITDSSGQAYRIPCII